LPGRPHIVLTRRERWDCEGADVVRSVDEAVALLAGEPASVIGGAAIFDVFLPIATRAELTEIHADFDGDVFMRPLPAGWGVVAREDHGEDGDRPAYSFVSYERDEDSAA
jgi:dihydrofolate reductase